MLTGDADVGFPTLGGPCRAPGHTLTPEVLRSKQLLHLLTCDLYAGFSHHQAWEDRWKMEGKLNKRLKQTVDSICHIHSVQTLGRYIPSCGTDQC